MPFSDPDICPNLVDPMNGDFVTMTGKSVGDIAVYTCNSGFELVGATNLTCQIDGYWSDPPPLCEAIGMRKNVLVHLSLL